MDSYNNESRNVRISSQCKGLPEGTRAPWRVPLHWLRARLSSAPVVRIQARSLGHTGEGLGEAVPEERRPWIRFRATSSYRLRLSGLSWILDCLEARGTRKGEGCVGRRSRPAQRAEAKRTPEQPGRGRRDDPLSIRGERISSTSSIREVQSHAEPRWARIAQF